MIMCFSSHLTKHVTKKEQGEFSGADNMEETPAGVMSTEAKDRTAKVPRDTLLVK